MRCWARALGCSMNRTRWSNVLLSVSAVYTVLIIGCVGALFLIPVFPTFSEGDRMASGCYITEAYLAGASCHGFLGSEAAHLFLQLPFYLVLGPFLALGALGSGELWGSVLGALYFGFSVSLWAPLVYLWRATQQFGQADAEAPRRLI